MFPAGHCTLNHAFPRGLPIWTFHPDFGMHVRKGFPARHFVFYHIAGH